MYHSYADTIYKPFSFPLLVPVGALALGADDGANLPACPLMLTTEAMEDVEGHSQSLSFPIYRVLHLR